MSHVNAQTGEYSCGLYLTLCQTFLVGSSEQALADVLRAHQEELDRHGNGGLAELVLEAFPIHRLLRISRIYTTISLTGLGQAMGHPYASDLTRTECALVSEISKGSVQASIDKQTGIVTFSADNMGGQSTATLSASLARHLEQAMATSDRLRSLHADVISKRKFVARSLMNHHTTTGGGSVVESTYGYSDVYLE